MRFLFRPLPLLAVLASLLMLVTPGFAQKNYYGHGYYGHGYYGYSYYPNHYYYPYTSYYSSSGYCAPSTSAPAPSSESATDKALKELLLRKLVAEQSGQLPSAKVEAPSGAEQPNSSAGLSVEEINQLREILKTLRDKQSDKKE